MKGEEANQHFILLPPKPSNSPMLLSLAQKKWSGILWDSKLRRGEMVTINKVRGESNGVRGDYQVISVDMPDGVVGFAMRDMTNGRNIGALFFSPAQAQQLADALVEGAEEVERRARG